MHSRVFCSLVALLALVTLCSALNATIYVNQQGGYVVKMNVFDLNDGVAAAIYEPTFLQTGYDSLHIRTNPKHDDFVAAYAAGYLEGVLTQQRIWDHWNNLAMYTWGPTRKMPAHVAKFLDDQMAWTKAQVFSHENDPYWQQVGTVYQQYIGLVGGYNSIADSKNQSISFVDMHTIASFGDLFEIMGTNEAFRPNFKNMSSEQLMNFIHDNSHCSALIKVTADLSEMYFGHTSWFTYSAMIRIYKEYTFNFKNALNKAKTVTFSSYPANLASNDDYYMTSNQLVVIETSIGFFNASLYSLIKPQSLLCWQRVILANRFSDSAPEWAKWFAVHNSGTYNNQFMALDLKRFVPKTEIKSDTLWIAEQLPGQVTSGDVSNILELGYWPSYNVPYFKNVYAISGYQEMAKKPGASDMLSYDTCVRANIFRRDQSLVTNMDGIKRILRYNDWQHDPLSKNNPSFAISSRHDLGPSTPRRCGGGYDTKVSSASAAKRLYQEIINGPTYDQQPVFYWSKGQCDAKYAHQGHPDEWHFPWTSFSAVLNQ